MPEYEEIEPNAYRWGTIFAILSLDLARPYLVEMGLPPHTPESFAEGLRRIIQYFRVLQSEHPGQRLPFAKAVFDWTSEEYGTEFAQYLYNWGRDVFQYGGTDSVPAFFWNIIVRRGGLDGARDRTEPPVFIRLLRGRLAASSISLLRDAEPSTPWDREVFERQGYDATMNPKEWINATINHYSFVRAWQDVVAVNVAKTDFDAVYRWGREVAVEAGMPLDRIGRPGDWPLVQSLGPNESA